MKVDENKRLSLKIFTSRHQVKQANAQKQCALQYFNIKYSKSKGVRYSEDETFFVRLLAQDFAHLLVKTFSWFAS